jgi:hypothetical protein
MVMGFWADGVTSFEGLAASKNSVGNTVNNVAKLVINKINTNFELDPPLALNDNDMGIAWIPRKYEYCNILFAQLTIVLYEGVDANTNLSSLDDKGLITIVRPSNKQTLLRVKNRLEEIKGANAEGMASAAYLIHT